MLRFLIVAEDAQQEAEMVWRARAARRRLEQEAQITTSARRAGLVPVARLDAGLYTRPLPDRLVIVGRSRACSAATLASLATVLDLRPDLAAVTLDAAAVSSVESLLELGGAFRGGPLCQAGGFAGDGRRPVPERLAALGFESIELPALPRRTLDLRAPWSAQVSA